WGVAAAIRTSGTTRFADADKWWSEQVGRARVRDEVAEPGSGLIAFGSFAFADEPGESVLLVPSVVLGRRGATAWITVITADPDAADADDATDGADAATLLATLPAPAPALAPESVSFADGALNGEQWMSAVGEAVRR